MIRRLILLFLCVLAAPAAGQSKQKTVIVLGFDGMDHELTQKLLAEGRLPNLARIAEAGTFQPLGTSIPPQSPVAWSNFITGMDAGGHGIFDFVHRDPKTMIPYLSTSQAHDAEKTLKIGKYQVPLSGGSVELLRHGEAFWEVLERNGIPTTVLRMPANFPPSGKAHRELSGMGTPDILGTYGSFSFYTYDASGYDVDDVSGGRIYEVSALNHVVSASLEGPRNPFLTKGPHVTAPFSVFLDPELPAAMLEIGDEKRVIKEGEWTDWVPIRFDLVPTQSIEAIVRFYLKEVRPVFQLYATPVNFDPMSPALPISTPASFARELAESSGRFYTQGMPEDTHALGEGVFDRDEFLAQAEQAGDEIIAQYEHVLSEFHEGFLFCYFGNADQVSHMMWGTMDPEHPAYDSTLARFADVVPKIYEKLDRVVGVTLERMDPGTTLMVMSDHGFTSYRREFHLNAWLRDQGYLAVRDPGLTNDPGFFTNVDWTRTRAYGLGLNGLYVNLEGRERWGIVPPGEREALMEEIAAKLLATTDPASGGPAVTKMYNREETYKDRGHLELGPDLVVGYAKRTRCSNDSAKGAISPEVFTDNTESWNGDHCMDHEAVPGVLFTNRPLQRPAPSLDRLALAILAEYGIEWHRAGS